MDNQDQPEYVGDYFIKADALELLASVADDPSGIDAIHASPPCQAYTEALHGRPEIQAAHPRLIKPVRELLIAAGKPYVIENVPKAPLIQPVVLCGAMDEFPDLRVLRHRLFECSFPVPQPEHRRHPLVVTLDKRKGHYGRLDPGTDYVGVYGGGHGATVAQERAAMGIDWMKKGTLNQAIPPQYTAYIGGYLRKYIESHD